MKHGWSRISNFKNDMGYYFWDTLHHPTKAAKIGEDGKPIYAWFGQIHKNITSDLEWLLKVEELKSRNGMIDGTCYENGRIHCDDGPARETPYQTEYSKYGFRHREDGPAYVRFDGLKRYYLFGREYPYIENDESWATKVKEVYALSDKTSINPYGLVGSTDK